MYSEFEMSFSVPTKDGFTMMLDDECIIEIMRATAEVTPKDIKRANRKKMWKRFLKSDFIKYVKFFSVCFLIAFVLEAGCFLLQKEQAKNFVLTSNVVYEHYQDYPSFADIVFTDELIEQIRLHKIDLYGINIGKRLNGDEVSAFFEASEDAEEGVLDKIKIVSAEEAVSEYDGSTYMQYTIGLAD